MRELAKHLWQLNGFPPQAINVYLAGDVLIDAATRWAGRRLLRQLGERTPSMLALTHVHPDHQGVARLLCEQFQVPLACHAEDVPTMQGERSMLPNNALLRLATRLWAGPPHRVDRVLQEGDDVGGFRVIHAPGHTPGHVIYFRDDDRVAIAGDVLLGMNMLTAWPGPYEPLTVFCTDPAENRRSILRLAELEPRLICFGHGPPLTDMRKLEELLKRLPKQESSRES